MCQTGKEVVNGNVCRLKFINTGGVEGYQYTDPYQENAAKYGIHSILKSREILFTFICRIVSKLWMSWINKTSPTKSIRPILSKRNSCLLCHRLTWFYSIDGDGDIQDAYQHAERLHTLPTNNTRVINHLRAWFPPWEANISIAFDIISSHWYGVGIPRQEIQGPVCTTRSMSWPRVVWQL